MTPELTGNEPWLVAFQRGAEIWMRGWGDKDFTWPVVFVEMDTALIKIDVCGLLENKHLDDCAQLRINGHWIVDHENFYHQP